MTLIPFFFYLCAAVLVLASLFVVLARNPLYNVLALVVVIFCLSTLFMLLEAYFVGMVLLLVYAGAVLVFFLFVVMCLNLNTPSLITAKQNRFRLWGGLAAFMFLAGLFLALKSFIAAQNLEQSSIRGTIEIIGKILFTEYLLPFELTSLLLLIAIFGIVSLAKGALYFGKEESTT
ncbi:MAG: NADH-quinone oxidoreductase subunit J [Candidatus Omnitrophica bacterium]|nr:NADH-quinone oxidoreductase subunit J [Candidatus Omnitrophota bacterium]